MAMRATARRFGKEFYCHRNVVNAQVTPDLTMPQAVRALTRDQCRVLMQWLTRRGPFWEDARQHSGDDWLECKGEIVTDSAVGEAAYCRLPRHRPRSREHKSLCLADLALDGRLAARE